MRRNNPNATAHQVIAWYAENTGHDVSKVVGKRDGVTSSRTSLTREQLDIYTRAVKRDETYPPVRTILLMLPRTGMRISEICSLHRSALCYDDRNRLGFGVIGKGSKFRFVPIGKKVVHLLSDYAEKSDRKSPWVFPARGNAQQHIAPATVEAAVRRIAETNESLPPGLTPHFLRHTYATMAMANGLPPDELQANLGHDSFKTTLTYLHQIAEMGDSDL